MNVEAQIEKLWKEVLELRQDLEALGRLVPERPVDVERGEPMKFPEKEKP